MQTKRESIEELSGKRRRLLEEAEQIDAMIMILQRNPQPTNCDEPEKTQPDQRASTRIADEVRSERGPRVAPKPPMTIQRKEELFKVAMGVAGQIGMQTNDREEGSFTLALAGMLLL